MAYDIAISCAVVYGLMRGEVLLRRYLSRRKPKPADDPFHPKINKQMATIQGSASPVVCTDCQDSVNDYREFQDGTVRCFKCASIVQGSN